MRRLRDSGVAVPCKSSKLSKYMNVMVFCSKETTYVVRKARPRTMGLNALSYWNH